jgi:hypothetical protein
VLDKFRTSVGIESDNVLVSLLAAVPMLTEPIGDLADAVAGAAVYGSAVINESTLQGAWALVENASRVDATHIGQRVLDSELVETSVSAFGTVLLHASAAVRVDRDRVGRLLAAHLTGEDFDEVFDDLEDAPTSGIVALLDAGSTPLLDALSTLLQESEATGKAAKQTTTTMTTAAATATTAASTVDGEDGEKKVDVGAILERLRDTAIAIHKRSPEAAEALLAVLLRLDRLTARNAAQPILALGKVTSPTVTDLVLEQVRPRTLSGWPTWLGAVQPAVVAKRPNREQLLSATIGTFLSLAQSGKESREDITATAAKLAALVDSAGNVAPALRQKALNLGDSVEDETDIPGYMERVDVAQLLVAAGLVEGAELNAAIARQLVDTIQVDVDAQEIGSVLSRFATDTLETVVNFRDPEGRGLAARDLVALVAAFAAPAWLAAPDAEYAQLLLRTIAGVKVPDDFPAIPTYAALTTSMNLVSKIAGRPCAGYVAWPHGRRTGCHGEAAEAAPDWCIRHVTGLHRTLDFAPL